MFGPNARLDVAGAFTASTTDAFRFADGQEFSATNPQAPPLLRLNITPGLQLGQPDQGDLENAGNLAVAAGQSLTLQGRNVRHTGRLTAPGGLVSLFGQTVGLLDNAQIDVSGLEGGGTVLIGGTLQGAVPELNALRTYIGPDVQIQADALRTGDGGVVVVWSEEATGFYGNISARGAVDSLTSPSNSGEQDLASGGGCRSLQPRSFDLSRRGRHGHTRRSTWNFVAGSDYDHPGQWNCRWRRRWDGYVCRGGFWVGGTGVKRADERH